MSPVPVQNVLDLIEAAVVLVGIVTIGFSTVGAIAVWREGKQGAGSFFRMFERLQVLQLLTVMLVIAAATLLGCCNPEFQRDHRHPQRRRGLRAGRAQSPACRRTASVQAGSRGRRQGRSHGKRCGRRFLTSIQPRRARPRPAGLTNDAKSVGYGFCGVITPTRERVDSHLVLQLLRQLIQVLVHAVDPELAPHRQVVGHLGRCASS